MGNHNNHSKHAEQTIVECPTCHKEVVWDESSPFRPFCSKRCQLIDLGEWANEEKAIPSDTADFAQDSEFDTDWTRH